MVGVVEQLSRKILHVSLDENPKLTLISWFLILGIHKE